MRTLLLLFLILFSSLSFAEERTAALVGDIFFQLQHKKVKPATLKEAKLVLPQSPLFRELTPELESLSQITAKTHKLSSFLEACKLPVLDEKSSALRRGLSNEIIEYCQVTFLSRYFSGKKYTSMTEMHYKAFRDWMGAYFKGDSKKAFVKFLKHVEPHSSLEREISFLVTEQAINNKIYPPEEILALVEMDRNLSIHVRRLVGNNGSSKKYFNEEFSRLAGRLNSEMDGTDRVAILRLTEQLETFYRENKELIDPESAWKNLLFSGRKLLLKSYELQASSLLKLAAEGEEEDQKHEAYFYLLMGHLLNKAPEKALAFIIANKLPEQFSSLSSKLKYWIAVTYQENKQSKKAEEAYLSLVQNDPLTFYSIMGMKALVKLKVKNPQELLQDSFLTGNVKATPYKSDFTPEVQKCFDRLALWLKKNAEGLALLELNDLQKQKTPEISYALIKTLAESKHYLLAFKASSYAFDGGILKADKTLLQNLFPSDLLPIVKSSSVLDPFLILALIRQESAFNKEARSGAGAQGLMQLLPKTAKRFRKGANKKNLFNPKINIEAGSRYLAHLLKINNDNLVLALASYNAGEGRVSEWKNYLANAEDPLFLIESIPFKETRDYVKLIYRNLFYYKLLFNQFDASFSEESFKIVVKKD